LMWLYSAYPEEARGHPRTRRRHIGFVLQVAACTE
jgi:hypothetical protein